MEAMRIRIDPLLCLICNKKYTSVGNLRVHLKDVHYSWGPYPCKFCHKVSRTSSGLRMHVRRHHHAQALNNTCSDANASDYSAVQQYVAPRNYTTLQ